MQSREMNRGLTQPAADRFGIFAPGGNQQELDDRISRDIGRGDSLSGQVVILLQYRIEPT
jgi:hypothetical protein